MKWLRALLIVCIACWAALPVQAAEHAVQSPNSSQLNVPTPPALVPCISATNCNRNPKDLEAFVEQFYKWYVANHETHFDTQLSKAQKARYRAEQRMVLDRLLTPRFLQWEKVAFTETVPVNHDFCPPDTAIFMCVQDYNLEEILKTKATTITTGNTEAIIQAHLNPRFPVAVRLKISKGYWKIDGVMRLDD